MNPSSEGEAHNISVRDWQATYREQQQRITALERENAALRERKDGAYEERNRVVAALARIFPSGLARTNIEGWDEEWHGCVYIDSPVGQLSWHYHDSQAYLFEGLPPYEGQWDGHTTEEKYQRLAILTAEEAESRAKAAESERDRLRALVEDANGLMREARAVASNAYRTDSGYVADAQRFYDRAEKWLSLAEQEVKQ